MLLSILRTIKGAAGLRTPSRDVAVLPDDTMLVSYPKSGNTWLRFLVGNLINPDSPVTFANVETRVPDIYQNSARALASAASPRLLKSHEYFDPRYRKVIYAVRDPRDVAVSYYHHCIKFGLIDDGYSLDHFVTRYISGKIDGYGTWAEHANSWMSTRGNDPDFLLVRYEDLHTNPKQAMSTIAACMGLTTTPERVGQAIELSTADRMRSLEKRQSSQWKATKHHRKDKPFVRSAKSGGWRGELSNESVEMIETTWGDTMDVLGYTRKDQQPTTVDRMQVAGAVSGN